MNKTLIVLLGPTGIGKSDLASKIAQYYQTEIISSDSRQIYRELSIGTAVPPFEDLKKVKHHLVHSHSIHDYYSASRFEQDSLKILESIFDTKDVAIMTGGSMLYIDAVCKGIDDIPDADPKLRAELIEEYEEKGIEHLRMQLKGLDPAYYDQVDKKNHMRLLHAIEICLTTGKPYSSLRTQTAKERPFSILKIGINRDRAELYQRINHRVDIMIQQGLEEEARQVYELRHLNSLNTVGYKELFAFFDGEIDRDKAIELIKRNTRHYARKQLTWFRKDKNITWFKPENEKEIINFTNQELEVKI